MRILQMGPYPPPHGGVQTNLVAIRKYLLDRGIPCAVVNTTRHRKPEADEVYYPKSPLQVVRLLARLRYDIIHLHLGGTVPLRVLGLAMLCCMMPRTRAVLTFHSGGYPESEEGRAARPRTLRGFVFRKFSRVIGVNQELIELFNRFGVPPEKLRLIHPHAPSVQTPADALSPELRRFFDSHEIVLTTVGLLEPEYDLSLQIEALGVVRERFPNAGLVIIGSGSLEEDLRKQIEGKSYRDHVLLCGDVPHAVTLKAIAESDLFLRTTLYDGDSVSVREALHLQVPVIATDNCMRPAGIRLIPASDIRALGEAIEQQLSQGNPPRRKAGQGAARKEPSGKEANLEAVLDIYRELMREMSDKQVGLRKVSLRRSL
ncbi:MAG TPA: glycosyltransferase family 4 protein [Blastocatellia bacterium]|jgi:glycosyltransferase involved in cell wall biosynthesis|nr:glycosyltransferase family 4 protein [Blastocatellia bacterium]